MELRGSSCLPPRLGFCAALSGACAAVLVEGLGGTCVPQSQWGGTAWSSHPRRRSPGGLTATRHKDICKRGVYGTRARVDASAMARLGFVCAAAGLPNALPRQLSRAA